MIKRLIEKNEQFILDTRRHLHENPELSLCEYETSALVKKELSALGIPFREVGTGVIADIQGCKPGKTVALRADMDALEVTEETELPFKSKTNGAMHACGHDGHTAALLGAARALTELKDQFSGKVRLIFQHAEEVALGAQRLIESGCMENVDNVFAIHLWADVPFGKISVEPGARMASIDIFRLEFTGKGGHGSAPHQCVDVIPPACAFINGMQNIISRETNPLETVVASVGSFHAGTRFNVIADKAVLEGSIRCFSKEMQIKMEEAMRRYATQIAAAYRADANFAEYRNATPPVINDEASSKLAAHVISEAFGEDTLTNFPKLTGSEDYAFYMEKAPGILALVGAGKEGRPYPHHHCKFEIDERALATATELYVRYALAVLDNN